MVDNPVNDRHRHVVVVEELAPAGEVLVGGQDDGPVFVQAVDQLEQVVAGLSRHRQVTQLIDDQQVVFGQGADPLFQLTLHLGQFQLFHQIQCVAEQHPVAGFHGFVAKRSSIPDIPPEINDTSLSMACQSTRPTSSLLAVMPSKAYPSSSFLKSPPNL